MRTRMLTVRTVQLLMTNTRRLKVVIGKFWLIWIID